MFAQEWGQVCGIYQRDGLKSNKFFSLKKRRNVCYHLSFYSLCVSASCTCFTSRGLWKSFPVLPADWQPVCVSASVRRQECFSVRLSSLFYDFVSLLISSLRQPGCCFFSQTQPNLPPPPTHTHFQVSSLRPSVCLSGFFLVCNLLVSQIYLFFGFILYCVKYWRDTHNSYYYCDGYYRIVVYNIDKK